MKKSTAKSETKLKLLDENNLSKAAEKKIEIANKTWGHARDTIIDVYKQLLDDGWDDQKAGKICLKRCNAFFSATTIRSILPPEAKNPNMIRHKPESKTPELEHKSQPEPEIATNSLQTTEDSSHQGEKQKTVPILQGGQQEASEPEETDSQRKARKYEEPQEEQSVREYGIIDVVMNDDSITNALDLNHIPKSEDIPTFSHSFLVRLVGCALERIVELDNKYEEMHEAFHKLEKQNQEIIAELEGSSSEVKAVPELKQKSNKSKANKYASLEVAQEYVRTHNIASKRQWITASKKDDWPDYLPKSRPEQYYGVSWNVILGKTVNRK